MIKKNKRGGIVRKIIAAGLVALSVWGAATATTSSDAYVRSKVVFIASIAGRCSGFVVEAPSHKVYVMSASHCFHPEEGPSLVVQFSTPKTMIMPVIKVDQDKDLILMGPIQGVKGLKVAGEIFKNEMISCIGFPHAIAMLTIPAEVLRLWSPPGESAKIVIYPKVIGGMSGGPAVNSSGEVIGVNDAADEALGYLVPLSQIKEFLKDK